MDRSVRSAPVEQLIGDMLSKGLLDEPAARRVRASLAEGTPLEEAVLSADGVTEERLLRFLGEAFEIPYVDLDKTELSREFLIKFPARLLLQHKLLPLSEENGVVLVATSRLHDASGLDELRLATGKDISIALAPLSEI